jgi:DNA-binding SARP family transcriptional activator
VLGLPGPCLATPSELAQCLDQLEQVPLPWLAFMVRRLLARRKDGRAQAVDAGALGPWATAVVSMIEGIDDAAGPGPSPSTPGLLARAGASFDRLGAPVVATWCLAWEAVALARVGAPTAVERCVAAAGRARAGAVPGALALASQAMALADKVSAPAHQSEAAAIASEWCVDLVPFELLGPTEPHPSISSRPVGTSVAATDRSPRPITLSCFGGFSLSIDGRAIDVTSIKPKARAVLYVVAMGAGRLVHRETIGEAVWPDVETKVSLRNLQVALSAIRRLLQPDGPSRTGAALIREGDAYRLGLPEPADVDVITFEQSLASARRAERGSEEMTAALSTALDAYRGDVLPEAGPAEWVIKLRDSYRTEAVGAALRLAEGFLAREQWRAAIRACERGLRIDAYQDGLWHVMVDAQTASGDRAAASRSRVAYDAVLGELGLAPATSSPRPHQGRSGVRPGDRART